MTIEAKVIADSIGAFNPRITTMQLRYPRFIHAEFMTHRVFSRNASSSRAIPVETQIEMIRKDTAMPSHWGKNQSGMQADEETDAPIWIQSVIGEDGTMFVHDEGYGPEDAWINARDRAIEVAESFVAADYHKQIVNRILEPFSHISVVVTATDYDNFFHLRRHKDAQPEIKILADAMYEAMEASTPRKLACGEWHLPYVSESERDYVNSHENLAHDAAPLTAKNLIQMSVARCARVSYLTHDGKEPSIENDLRLYNRLVGSTPLHASPAEHQATPDGVVYGPHDVKMWENSYLHGNLTGYQQYRKQLDGENMAGWGGLNTDFE